MGERELARFFGEYGIRFVYEEPVLVMDRRKPKIWYPDFHLPDFAAYVEYFGLSGDPGYDLGTERKMAAYRETGLAVVPVYPWNLGDGLDGYMASGLAEIQRSRSSRLADLYRQIEHGSYARCRQANYPKPSTQQPRPGPMGRRTAYR